MHTNQYRLNKREKNPSPFQKNPKELKKLTNQTKSTKKNKTDKSLININTNKSINLSIIE